MERRKGATHPVYAHTPLPPNLSLEFTEFSSAEYKLVRCKANYLISLLKSNNHKY